MTQSERIELLETITRLLELHYKAKANNIDLLTLSTVKTLENVLNKQLMHLS